MQETTKNDKVKHQRRLWRAQMLQELRRERRDEERRMGRELKYARFSIICDASDN
jgi:hypothetical protein